MELLYDPEIERLVYSGQVDEETGEKIFIITPLPDYEIKNRKR